MQLMHGPALDAVFKAITFTGEEEFFLVLLPLILWCVDFAVGMRLAFAFLLSTWLNVGLKHLFAHPRPFDLDPELKLYDSSGYGLPSGHSQAAVVVWSTLANAFRTAWLWAIAIVLTLLVGVSRVYLGVHFPTDVLGGWAVGALFLIGYFKLAPRVESWLERADLSLQLALAIALPLGLLLLHPAGDTVSSMAVLMGMGVGLALIRRAVHFSAAGSCRQRAARFVVGAIVLLPLYFGLKKILPGTGEPLYTVGRVVRYAVLGLWAGLGAPWLFRRLRLTSRGSPSP